MAGGDSTQGRFPSVGDRQERPNTTSLLGEAFLKLGGLIAAGAVAAGFPQRQSHSVVFAHIDVVNGTRLTELAARASITPQAMSDVVNDMIERGYVVRRPDPADRRAKRIHLTAAGVASVEAGLATIARIEAQLEQILGPDRLHGLRAALHAIIQASIHH